MKINLIIGAGQLGSRHLQGMLKWKGPQKIYVVDPFEASLNTAFERSKEVDHKHELVFTKNLNEVPQNIDLAIIATQSNVREAIITNFLLNTSVKYLILEKVLFQEIDSFYRIKELLKNTKTWVNHPRRMVKFYQELREKEFMKTQDKIFSVFGVNWGLGCNGLHFIDLISFLAKSELKALNTSWLDKEIDTSKRSGYIEFTGTLLGELLNGDKFVISSKKGNGTAVTLNVNYSYNQVVIVEGAEEKQTYFPNEDKKVIDLCIFESEFQSNLTTKICEDIFETGNVSLPSYEEAMNTHLPFIQSFLDFMNTQNNTNEKLLPIT